MVITDGSIQNLAPSEIDYTVASGGGFTDGNSDDGVAILGPAIGATFNVQSTLGGSTTEILGGTGKNTINVGSKEPAINGNLVPIQGALTVHSIGTDTLNVDDTSIQGPKSGTLTPSSLLGLGMGDKGIAFSGLTTLNLNMGPAALPSDTFDITKINVASLVTGPTYAFATQIPAGRLLVSGNIASVHVDTGTPGSFAGPVATVTLYEGYSPWTLHEIYNPQTISNVVVGATASSPPSTAPSSNPSSVAQPSVTTPVINPSGGASPPNQPVVTSPPVTAPSVTTIPAPDKTPSVPAVSTSSAAVAGPVTTEIVASAGGSPPPAAAAAPPTPQPSLFSLFHDLFEMELNLVELELSWLLDSDNFRDLPSP